MNVEFCIDGLKPQTGQVYVGLVVAILCIAEIIILSASRHLK